MRKLVKTSGAALLVGSLLLSSTSALAERNAEDRYIYIGTELGFSEPVVKKFKETDLVGRTTRMRLKQSKMYGVRVGYSFYPNMMIELSATHQPKYRLHYKLPAIDLSRKLTQVAPVIPGAGLLENPDRTKVSADVFTLNWIYEFEKQFADIKPYVVVGAGVAKVTIASNSSNAIPNQVIQAIPPLAAGFTDLAVFKVRKNTMNCFVWQLGGGLSRDIGENFAIDLGAKLQVVKDIKIKYDVFNVSTQKFEVAKPIKKTIGVGEFTLGFTFKLPV